MSKLKPAFKLWFETGEAYVFGQGTFELLQKIREVGTLSGAAEALGMSYRYAWSVIKRTEKRIGEPLLKTRKGGRLGGGGAELTQTGQNLIREFTKIREVLLNLSADELTWEELFVKISARNRMEGEVLSVEKGDVAATVKIKVTIPCVITSLITREAVEDLKIKKGDKIAAIIKATEVMLSKEME